LEDKQNKQTKIIVWGYIIAAIVLAGFLLNYVISYLNWTKDIYFTNGWISDAAFDRDGNTYITQNDGWQNFGKIIKLSPEFEELADGDLVFDPPQNNDASFIDARYSFYTIFDTQGNLKKISEFAPGVPLGWWYDAAVLRQPDGKMAVVSSLTATEEKSKHTFNSFINLGYNDFLIG
jgi:hypothetical protein